MPGFFLSTPGLIALVALVALVVYGRGKSVRPATSAQAAPASSTALVMQVVISLVVLAAGLYVILGTSNADDHKWAYSIVGTVVGYWLRSAT